MQCVQGDSLKNYSSNFDLDRSQHFQKKSSKSATRHVTPK